ncbi:hypothetical protein Clacol_003089 [Clathrus columnatus]|uniref:Uncharacterized protein n=1 Tax=Clathrus columnatus TaxID=1419009 RepID=A0AAV5A6J2_9AGAM|nr:hypothetical protein Clacol_003089 [Clathrus columnatus]
MLNDVMSLIVALYAIKLSKSKASPQYSYGWHRAEIVAALINGVFLLALCFSIFMEAIERFFSTPEISTPKLVVIVGSLGLASNFLGLFLFHEHSHDHGDQSHSSVAQPNLNKKAGDRNIHRTRDGVLPLTTDDLDVADGNVNGAPRSNSLESFNQLYGYPAATRASLVQAAQNLEAGASDPDMEHYYDDPPTERSDSGPTMAIDSVGEEAEVAEDTREGASSTINVETPMTAAAIGSVPTTTPRSRSKDRHARPGSMNMRALVLHVLGDALGNVGVIATGLVIWLSTWEYRFYFDPVISLVITVIIFSSAMPLVRSAAFILLQAVPSTVSLQDLRVEIQRVPGVLSVHELHVWQLSETKLIASVHVWASRKRDYMHIGRDIRRVLHEHGIHSTTIQPEFHDGTGSFCHDGCAPAYEVGHGHVIDEEHLIVS